MSVLDVFGPGTYDATLHEESRFFVDIRTGRSKKGVNDDYFRFDVPTPLRIVRPTIAIHDTDAPLSAILYAADMQTVIKSWSRVRDFSVQPPTGTTCYLKVFGDVPNRYRITARLAVDRDFLPDLQEQLEFLPKWWGDPPPFRIDTDRTHYLVEVSHGPDGDPGIAFERPDEDVRLELLTDEGETVVTAENVDTRLFLDTADLADGMYVLRATRPAGATDHQALKIAPPFR